VEFIGEKNYRIKIFVKTTEFLGFYASYSYGGVSVIGNQTISTENMSNKRINNKTWNTLGRPAWEKLTHGNNIILS